MPRATLASRALNNKDTGLDLFVPTYREDRGIVTIVAHFQVVLVSSLSCFKAPSHKESDIVQYSIEKKFGEFEELRGKISELFPATMLPPISKKSMIVTDQVLRERRNSLNNFVKFLATTEKLSTCQPLLEFLGVDLIRAKKFSRGESLDQNKESSKPADVDTIEEKTPDNDFFEGEEDNIAEDLFEDELVVGKTGEESIFDSDEVAVFGGQDLKRELTEEDEKDFSFIPDAIISKKVTITNTKVREEKETQEYEDHSDLFEFDDDLDQLMNVKISHKTKEAISTSVASLEESQPEATASSAKPKIAKKPVVPEKPSIASKPAIPSKPKPGAKAKALDEPGAGYTSDPKKDEETSSKADVNFVDDLGQDDILKYLQAQSESADDDLDLFS